MRAALTAAATILLLAIGGAGQAAAALPPVKHVFIIVLENKDYDQSFGEKSPADYIAKTLPAQGQLLEQYYGTSHVSLGNYISMISGQAPNPDTQSDCNRGFTDIFPGVVGADGQVVGSGCVYPAAVKTVADQLEEKGLSWKGYMQDMGNSPTAPKTCRHPAIGETDDTQSARVGDQYATRHNPFVYFHSIIDDQAGCDARVVPFDRFAQDLGKASTTPNLAFITPNLCEDGHDAPCVDGRPGGLQSADVFVKTWAPAILASPAYADGGLLLVTWDEGSGPQSDSSACCGQPTGPNTPMPGILGPGGGRTGTVVVSPFTQPGTRNKTQYNHYALLRSIEDLFGLAHLGYAGNEGLKAFGDDVFNAKPVADPGTKPPAKGCSPPPLGKPRHGRYPHGSFLSGVRRHGRTLVITTRRAGRLTITLKGKKVHAPAKLGGCRTLRVHLPKRHGVLRIAYGSAGGREHRRLKA